MNDLFNAAVQYALDNWCVPCEGTTDGEEGDGDYVVSSEVTDRQFRAMYQLWYLWAKEDGRNINDEVWAAHFASLVLASACFPVVVWKGEKPVGTAVMVLQADPWDGKKVSYGDHAYVLPEHRASGCLYSVLEECYRRSVGFGADKIVMPIAREFDWEKYKPWYEAVVPGWEVYSKILINHLEK